MARPRSTVTTAAGIAASRNTYDKAMTPPEKTSTPAATAHGGSEPSRRWGS
jgi:hypothetical protein